MTKAVILKLWWFVALFQRPSYTRGSCLEYYPKSKVEEQKKGHHFKTASNFLIFFLSQVKIKKKKGHYFETAKVFIIFPKIKRRP